MTAPLIATSEGDWKIKFAGKDVVLALNILHAIQYGTLNMARRATKPLPYGYDWGRLKDIVLKFFESRAWFLEIERDGSKASHSAVASELYPHGLRTLHALLKSNYSLLANLGLDVDNLLKSTFLWPDGHLQSSIKRGFLHDLLVFIEAKHINEAMLR